MGKLSVPLSAITEGGVVIDVTVSAAQLQPEDAQPLPVGDVRVQGKLQHIGNEYLFTGTLTGTYERQCDRCLCEVAVPCESSVIWSFHSGRISEEPFAELSDEELEQEEQASFGFEGAELPLGAQVWEELVLNAPTKYLCREDCAGLCPHCGANLNEGPCSCPTDIEEKTMDNTGFKDLGKMFPGLKPKDPEE